MKYKLIGIRTDDKFIVCTCADYLNIKQLKNILYRFNAESLLEQLDKDHFYRLISQSSNPNNIGLTVLDINTLKYYPISDFNSGLLEFVDEIEYIDTKSLMLNNNILKRTNLDDFSENVKLSLYETIEIMSLALMIVT